MEVITEIDAQAIDRLFHEHYEGLSRYAFSILKEQGAAEDVVQQLFITLWEKRDDLEISKDPRAYLYRSTYNRCLNEVKRVKRKGIHTDAAEEYGLASDDDASGCVLGKELEERIETALQTLPEKCGEVFRMSRFKELSYKEIAEKLDISTKTVENHMGKALRLMREELKDYLPLIVITILLIKGW